LLIQINSRAGNLVTRKNLLMLTSLFERKKNVRAKIKVYFPRHKKETERKNFSRF
jgi:hypothetical protein